MEDTVINRATEDLMGSLGSKRSRASFFKGAAIAGASVAGVGFLAAPEAFAAKRQASPDSVAQILTVARTAEQLAVTFYHEGLQHHSELGLSGHSLNAIKAALIEEQIHLNFFAANGGESLASTFSFPHGPETFKKRELFFKTQEQLEGVFDSAFLAAVSEFAQLGSPALAQVAAQVATVETMHLALGRFILGVEVADNWAFAPVLLTSVGYAPTLVKNAGYLSPTKGNKYIYHAAEFNSKALHDIYRRVRYKKPYAAS